MSARAVECAAVCLIAAAVVGSGVAVVQAKHESRQLFAELEALKREKDRLQMDWGRLRIEQSLWATHARIESVARDELGLGEPDETQSVVLAEPAR